MLVKAIIRFIIKLKKTWFFMFGHKKDKAKVDTAHRGIFVSVLLSP